MNKIVILDDEKKAIIELTEIIDQLKIPNLDISCYHDVDTLIKDIKLFPSYTIFLLDIVLPQSNGIEIAKYINNNILGAAVIFISSYLAKAPEVYETDHCYFVYKPQLKQRLALALNKAMEAINNNKSSIVLKLKDCSLIIPCYNIYYLERDRRTTKIFEKEKNTSAYYDLDYFLSILPKNFVRCHRSYIVNLSKVISISRNEFTLDNSCIVHISRSYQKAVHEAFHLYLLHK